MQTKAGDLGYPTFNREYLRDLRSMYGDYAEWEQFAEVLEDPIYAELVLYRHGGTHTRRAGSALNGGLERIHTDEWNPSAPKHSVTRGMDPLEHIQAVFGIYTKVVLPSVNAAAALSRRHSPRHMGTSAEPAQDVERYDAIEFVF